MMKRKASFAFIWLIPLAVFMGSCKKDMSVAPITTNPMISETHADSSAFILPCGATLPTHANSSFITLSCTTPVDLSSLQHANSSTIYACVAPSKLPLNFNLSAVSIITGSAICADLAPTCSGPSICSGSSDATSLTFGCGSIFPCHANVSRITITCPTLTDLSAIQHANSTTIITCTAPCKLPVHFDSSTLIVDVTVCK